MTVRTCHHCKTVFATNHPGRAKFCGQPCYFEALRLRNPAKERFVARIEIGGPDDCWLWQEAPLQTGYGQFWLNGKNVSAHVAAFILFKGPIPEGMNVCHRCDTPLCMNPRHLFAGTQKENMQDKVAKGRANSPRGLANGAHTCPASYPRREQKVQAKLSRDSVSRIVQRYAAGDVTQAALAREHAVDPSLISRVVRGLAWQ